MTDIIKKAYEQRNSRRAHALAAIKSTQSRLRPVSLKNEAQQALQNKAMTTAANLSKAAKRNRGKIITAALLATGSLLGAFLYKPLKKRLSEDRKN